MGSAILLYHQFLVKQWLVMDVNHIRHLRLKKKGVSNLQGLSGFGHMSTP